MNKYLKVLFRIFENNIASEVQYRKNFFIRLLSQALFVILQIMLIEIYFQFTSEIGTWTHTEVLVLAGIFRLIEGSFHIFFHSSLLALPDDINRGELDGLLAKPINSLFMVSLREFQLYEITTFVSGFIILFYAVGNNLLFILAALMAAVTGLVSLYAIMVMVSSLSFYISRLTAMGAVWDTISKSVRFPLDIFSPKLVFFLAPFLLVSTLPSQLILGKVSPEYWLIQLLGSGLLFILANKFWNFALRHYSSASS